jgi:hypothetical protein
MTSRHVRVGRQSQIVTTEYLHGAEPGFEERHEHVTLSTPDPLTDTQRMRLMTAREARESWQPLPN